ncbi:hypothetical protein BH09GEM1_BH09GEM1_02110 [soil metagenome]
MNAARCFFVVSASVFAWATLRAQQPAGAVARVSSGDGFDFTIPNIMRGPELYGRAPTNVRWSADGRWIHFLWNAPGTDWREPLRPYRVRSAAGAVPERLTLAQADSALPYIAEGPLSPDGRTRVVEASGDIYLVAFNGTARRLTQTVANESRPTFSSDGKTVYFLRDNNAFAMSLAGGEVRQLTDIRTGPAPIDIADGRIGIARAGLNAERGDRVLLLAAQDAQREAIAHLRNADSLGESVVERLETEIDIDEMVIRGEADRLTGAEAG